ncbi:MAG: undecaprenyl-diphosphatase [Gemmatimonadetes bacterium]|nr:MAG: undecaprenyl-diphosphatase [Gemmatimonadota bacterium]
MNLWQGILLGLVQGLTEFLPVSSSGHLSLLRALTGLHLTDETFVFVAVTLHVATLCSVLVVYGRRLLQIVVGTLRGNPGERRYAVLLVVGTVPGALLGALFHERFEQAFGSLLFIGGAFIVTGLILWSTRWAKVKPEPLTVGGALQIGLAQAVAIFPGISRSGSTVSAALWRGLAPVEAAEFSFLLAVIIIAGSGVFEARHAMTNIAAVGGVVPLIASFVLAFASGIWAIRFLVAMLRRGRFHAFAPYCFAVGLFTLGYVLWHG